MNAAMGGITKFANKAISTKRTVRSDPVICFIVNLKPIETIIPSTKIKPTRLYSVFRISLMFLAYSFVLLSFLPPVQAIMVFTLISLVVRLFIQALYF